MIYQSYEVVLTITHFPFRFQLNRFLWLMRKELKVVACSLWIIFHVV